MTCARVMDIELEQCNLDYCVSLLAGSPTKSRKRSYQEAVQENTPCKDTSLVCLANTSLRSQISLQDSALVVLLRTRFSAFQTGSNHFRFSLPSFLIAADHHIVSIKGTRGSNKIFVFNLDSLDLSDSERLAAQIKFLKRLKSSKKSPSLSYSQEGFCDIVLKSEAEVSVSVSVSFEINIHESILQTIHPIDVAAIEQMMHFEVEECPTAYQRSMNSDDIQRLRFDKASPEMFYELITYNTQETASEHPEDNTPDKLNGDLIKFQRDSVEWLLRHEGVRYDPESRTVSQIPFWEANSLVGGKSFYQSIDKCLDRLSFGFVRVRFHGNDEYYYYNKYSGNLCSETKAKQFVAEFEYPPAQGLLAEEMGLGKTVEIISLVLLNPRPAHDSGHSVFDNFAGRSVNKAKTTLIICPDSIISQWSQEIGNYAPHLSSTIYKGIYNFEKTSKGETKTPTEMAEELSRFDIVLVSYQVVARELHRALFNPSSRPKRRCARNLSKLMKDHDFLSPEPKVKREELDSDEDTYHRIDYSSPLMLLQFWRIVLDEVQMVSSKISNAAKICRIIPRCHAWGVSGTPIRNNLADLQSTLSFLRFSPFDETSAAAAEASWGKLVDATPPHDFIRLWKLIALRHTKSMVAGQIKLPEQNRVLLTVPFSAVEQDNYDHLFESFLSDVSLNERGEPTVDDWEPTSTILGFMRQWLVRLRQTCCHAQIRQGNVRKRINENLGLGTIDTVLEDIRKESRNDIMTRERYIAATKLIQGQIREYQRRPHDAIKIWEEVQPYIQLKLEEFRTDMKVIDSSDDSEDNQGSTAHKRIRSWLELLHRVYFFLGSGHYQLYNPLPPLLENANLDEYPNKDDIEDQDLDPEDLKLRLTEREFYDKAETLRRELLEDSINKVRTSVENLKHKLKEVAQKNDKTITTKDIEQGSEVPIVPVLELQDGTQFTVGLESRLIFDKYTSLIDSLNKQAGYINSWIGKISEVLQRPLNDDEADKTGKEYQASLDDQEITFNYLEILQLVLEDRELCVLTLDDSVAAKKKPNNNLLIQTFHSQEESELRKELNEIRNSLLPDAAYDAKLSMRSLLARIKEQLDELSLNQDRKSEVEAKLLGTMYTRMKKDYDIQKKSCTLVRKIFSEALNETYNSRIEYYRSLQAFSDSVKPYAPSTEAGTLNTAAAVDAYFESLSRKVADAEFRVRSQKARLHYLESLKKGLESDSFSEEDRFCTICQCSIVIGSLTTCGHQYCKECLEEWMKNKKICPICKTSLRSSNIYNFTFPKAKLKGNMMLSSDEQQEHPGVPVDSAKLAQKQDIFSLYKPMKPETLQQIQEIELVKSYGSKVDLLVKQVLWLKKYEPSVQIIIFSQWADFLYVIGIALKQNKVSYLGSSETLSNKNTSTNNTGTAANISKFKNDSSITCFLLNAKAQAAGLTLVNASHVFLCEPLVNSPLELQAISRIHRIGQKHKTTVWMFVIENSVEESIVYLSTKKRLELIKKKRGDVVDESEEAQNNTIDSVELSKTLTGLVDKRSDGGEVVANDELWASFFSAKTSYI